MPASYLLFLFILLDFPWYALASRLQFGQHQTTPFSKSSIQAKSITRELHSPNVKRNNLNTNSNGSTFLWLLQDEYSGKTFFENFTFFSDKDPTK
ncbi:hypothetical protein H2248_000833 [Termitomyces sp. 'cryptogamus']|nr:hypothetical protein H2248_000833 [Termitomyces sp. 'cryptogamus']